MLLFPLDSCLCVVYVLCPLPRWARDKIPRLSVDGDKPSSNGSADPVEQIMSRMKKPKMSKTKPELQGKKQGDNLGSKFPVLRRREWLVVLAVDCYDDAGATDEKSMVPMIHNIIKAVRSDPQWSKNSGFAISTSMPLDELAQFLKSAKIQVNEFDTLICSSRSEVYYPGLEDGKLLSDPDYASHIDYRWGNEGLKNTVWKLMNTTTVGGECTRLKVEVVDYKTVLNEPMV